MTIGIRLNGRHTALECEPTDMLLDALRDEGLTSVRETCRIGVCGACTVLLDGEPVTGCLTMAAQARGREVTTVEGLDGAHPVQRAFVAARAFQCGWCTPGFVLMSRQLLDETPDPSQDQIKHYLSGNLCRCGAYREIVDAVQVAARTRAKRREEP